MKFTNGQWALREGVSLLSPRQVRNIRRTDGKVVLYAPVMPVVKRDDTLNMPQLTFEIDAPLTDVLRVRIYHFKGVPDRGPHFVLRHEKGSCPRVSETDDELSVASGRLVASIRKNGSWRMQFSFGGRCVTGTETGDTAYVRDADGRFYMRERLALGVGECVYGLGERFTPFVKNGQSVDMWNEDGGTASDIAYKNVPFYVTTAGYGVLVNHPERVSFEVASEAVSRVQFSVPGERLEYYLIGGDTPREVLRRYSQLSGRPALPPAWSFGLWLTTSFTTDYDEATVSGFVTGMRERAIPLHVFHFDCFWMKEFQWCDFEWDRDQFPDPRGFIERLKGQGLRVCVWINPYIGQKSRLFEEGMAGGFLLRKPDGSVFQWDKWQAGVALVDFTSPDAVRWYKDRLRALLRTGVDCFKTDFGERIPVDVVYADGSDPQGMHNFYSYLYNKVVFELLEEEKGPGNAVVFARSATVGGQTFPVHWGGDSTASYESMAETLRGGLSLGMSGFGFWSHDIGGFEKTATPDLYKRWVAFGLLSSHSRLHGFDSYRVPWLFDEESVDVLRTFVQLKCRLMPYLYGVSCEAAAEGVPVMRAMVLEFSDDPACAYLDRQYMLGPSLLCAPVMNPEGWVSYYVPGGRWTDFFSGAVHDGGMWRREKRPYREMPLLVRPGALIPVGASDTLVDYDYADGVTFHAFEIPNGRSATAVVHTAGGKERLSLTVERAGAIITARAQGDPVSWTLLLRGVTSAGAVSGGAARATPRGTEITVAPGSRALRVELGNGAG
jgi:alpha-D-xyloside xylohydrolase